MNRSDFRNTPLTILILRGAALGVATLAFLLLLTSGSAQADDWKFSVTPYVWMTDIGMSATLGGRQVIDKQIPVSDLLAVLDTIFQGRVGAQHGSVGATLDFFDVTLSDEVGGVALPGGAGQADLTSHVGMTILDVAGFYDRKGDGQGIVFLYGTRVLDQRATIDLTSGPTVSQSYVTDDWLVDGLAGVRFTQQLSHHWGFQIQADASTGSTDYTWSICPSVSYAFGRSGRYQVDAGYRRMAIDFQTNGDFTPRMTLSGALVGFQIAF